MQKNNPRSRIMKHDCRWYTGDKPCWPNKQEGVGCQTCTHYEPPSRRWLIINLGAMGDVLRSTAILRGIMNEDPKARVTWITRYPDMLSTPHPVERVWSPDAASTNTFLAVESFDVAINVDKDPLAAALLKLANATKKRGFHLYDGKIFAYGDGAWAKLWTGVDDEASKANTKSYIQELYEIAELPYDSAQPPEYWGPPPFHHCGPWAGLYRDYEIYAHPKPPYVVLAPGCGKRWPTRQWGIQNWVSLIQSLRYRLPGEGTIFLVGGDEDKIMLKQIDAMVKKPLGYPTMNVKVVPTLDMKYLMNFLSKAHVVVTPVSFMLHAALAAEHPRVVVLNNIFNRAELELYGRGKILEPENPCTCYYASRCQSDRVCLAEIRVEEVAGVVVDEVMQNM